MKSMENKSWTKWDSPTLIVLFLFFRSISHLHTKGGQDRQELKRGCLFSMRQPVKFFNY